jgi:hypothetical protein
MGSLQLVGLVFLLLIAMGVIGNMADIARYIHVWNAGRELGADAPPLVISRVQHFMRWGVRCWAMNCLRANVKIGLVL